MRVTQTGQTVSATPTAQTFALPTAQNGIGPYFVRVRRDSEAFLKFGNSSVAATQNDILVTPYPQSYDVRGIGGYFSVISGSTHGVAHVVLTGTPIAAISTSATGGSPGRGYATVPTLTLSGNATATCKDKVVSATLADPGGADSARYVATDTITIADGAGTSTTAAVITVRTTQLTGLSLNAAGGSATHRYKPNDTITTAGGTGTKAVLTVTDTQLISANLEVKGNSWYVIGDTITLTSDRGVISSQPVLTVATMGLKQMGLNVVGSAYVVGDTITLAGGTNSVAGVITVDAVDASGGITQWHVSTAGSYRLFPTVLTQASTLNAAGGTGTGSGATFTTLFLGVRGTGGIHPYVAADTITLAGGTHSVTSVVTVDAVDRAGLITKFHVSTVGTYTVLPGRFTQGRTTSAAGTGATFYTIGGFDILTASVTTPGDFTANPNRFTQDTRSGAGLGSEWNLPVYGVLSFGITSGGSYTANTATPTQGSTSGSGTGATFKTGFYGVKTFTVSTAGAYTALPANPAAQDTRTGLGTGATFNLTWGIGPVTLGGTNTGYQGFPAITLSEIAPTPAVFITTFTATSAASVVVDNSGDDYLVAPTVTPSSGNATFTATVTNGGISSIAVGGTNTNLATVPTLVFSAGLKRGQIVNVVPAEQAGN